MSQPATETSARPAGKENIFTHKIGPLAMWVWLLIGLGALLAYAWWQNRNGSSSNSGATNTANASQVPQFVNQTYTTVTPPVAPGSVDHDKTPGGGGTPGGPGVPVPSVLGLNDTAADAKLKAAGFHVADTDEPKGGFGKKIGLYVVTNQSPGAGSKAQRGSTVTLTFGKKGAGANPGGPNKPPHGDNSQAVRAASTGVQPSGGTAPTTTTATGIAGQTQQEAMPWIRPRI